MMNDDYFTDKTGSWKLEAGREVALFEVAHLMCRYTIVPVVASLLTVPVVGD
jgi:hypothetical protein